MNCRLYWIVLVLTGFITWGCMTFRYVGNGFSLALIAFGIAVLLLSITEKYRPTFKLPLHLRNALISLYGILCIVGAVQYDSLQNLIGGSYSALTLFFITMPLWMILYLGRRYDIKKTTAIVLFGNLYAFCAYGFWLYWVEKQDRFSSFYGSPPEVGMLLDLFLPFSLAIGLYYWKGYKWRIATIFLIPLEVIALLLTETRGSYLAISGALLFTFFIWIRKRQNMVSTQMKLIISGVIGCVCVGLVIYTFFIGMENTARMVGGERLLMWESSYHMWKDNPIWGIGLSEWSSIYNDPESIYFMEQKKELTNVMPHNIYIFFLSTGGLVAFSGVLLYTYFMLKYLVRNISTYEKNPIAWAMLFMFIAFMAHGMVDGSLISKHIGRVFYLFLGLGILFLDDKTKI